MTYANVVSSLCLFFVLAGGSAFAASQITGAQIASNAITSAKVKNGSLLKVDFKPGQLPKGPRGLTGPQGLAGAPGQPGAPGAPGTARAFGIVNSTAGPAFQKSKGVTNVRRAQTGIYCITAPGIDPIQTAIVASANAGTPTAGAVFTGGGGFFPYVCTPQEFQVVTTTFVDSTVLSDAVWFDFVIP
jgi:hypothetical protein